MMHPTVKELRKAQRLRNRARDRAEHWEEQRDRLILQLIAEGFTHAQIHRALDGQITRARIGQIAVGRR